MFLTMMACYSAGWASYRVLGWELGFCTSAGILWTETTFFYMAYTGSAASAFGGRTITKASGMCSQNITDKQRLEWSQCKILVIDEVSFMTENELMKLDNKLKQYGQRNKVYGGYYWRKERKMNYYTRQSQKDSLNRT